MATTQFVLNMSDVILGNLKAIQNELGPEWAHFHRELALLLEHLSSVTDNDALERTIDGIWQFCCRYPFVKGLILGYDFRDGTEHNPRRWRKLEAANYEDETFVREVINRFQTLSDELKEVERSEGLQELAKQERKPIRYR